MPATAQTAASTSNQKHGAPWTSSLACQRCMQPLRLDDSLTDDALASAASSVSNDGLTKSNYDVISAIVEQKQDTAGRVASSADGQQVLAPYGQDADLIKAVKQRQAALADGQSLPSSSASPSSHNLLSSRLALHEKLFDMVSSYVPPSTPLKTIAASSSRTDAAIEELGQGIDHPLCRDCCDYCIEVMRSQMDLLRDERDAMRAWNKQMDENQGSEDDVRRMEAEISALEDSVRKATDALYQTEGTRDKLEEELKHLELEEKELEQQEIQFWEAHSKQMSENDALKAQRASLAKSVETNEAILARLNATNVLFDVFSIGHEGSSSSSSSNASSRKLPSGSGLATINGLRFGRISAASSSSSPGGKTVDWNEVNAAWGQVTLLMETLRLRIGGSPPRGFRGWRIRPKGSTSYLDKVSAAPASTTPGEQRGEAGDGSTSEDAHELYHPNSWASLTRVLHFRRFDAAMVAVLDCTAQLFAWAEDEARSESIAATAGHGFGSSPTPPRMVHVVNGEKIGDVSIRLVGAFTSEENWSRALKYLLVDLQVLMHWATRNDTVPVEMPSNGTTSRQT